MINILPDHKDKCCGCRACEQICPVRCISFSEDTEGFFYPSVNRDLCIGCGKCERVCPIISDAGYTAIKDSCDPIAFGVRNKDDDVRKESSSGGVFSVFADKILADGGLVCGCALDKSLKARHIIISSKEQLPMLRKSKYVQSDLTNIYVSVRDYLRQGKKVLFVGTPCQAAGLHSFIGQDTPGLYICDFICHGVPSQKIFDSYICSLEEKYGKIEEFSFRNKDRGWNSSGLQLGTRAVSEKGQALRFFPAFRDPYMNGFLENLYLRPVCYECPFKRLPKYYSDVTIADFWGIRKIDPSFDDGKGTSLVLINSDRGKELFESVRQECFVKQYDVRQATKKNPTLFRSSRRNAGRSSFFALYENAGFSKVQKKYLTGIKWAEYIAAGKAWDLVKMLTRKILSPVFMLVHKKPSDKQWENIYQFIKFCFVGVSNTLLSYGINVVTLLILSPLGWTYDYIIGNIAGFGLSTLWSFHLNNKYVFSLKKGEKRSKWKTLLKTYLSYGFSGFILNNILSTIWIGVLGISRFISPLLNIPFTIPVNFLLNKLWAYRRSGDTDLKNQRESERK